MAIATSSNPTALAAHRQRNQIHVTTGHGVHIIDAAALTIKATVPTGKSPHRVVVGPGSEHVYVGDGRDGTLTQLRVPDLSTGTSWT